MNLEFNFSRKGVELKSDKGTFRLEYPKKIWNNFSEKEFFLDNIAYLGTICMPLVSNNLELAYNTSKPFFKKEFDTSIIKDIPSAVEEYSSSAKEMLAKFKKTKFKFKDNKIKKPVFNKKTSERAIIPFSCGKDSLLTLAVCNEIGLNPVPIYINDTVSPSENKIKLKFIKKVAKKKKLSYEIVTNEIEKLNDFEFWNEPEADIGYSHMVMGFCFLSLPFTEFYSAKYIVLGNELDLNDTLISKDGIKCYPSFDQSLEGTKRLSKIINKATKKKISVTSVISPLYDLAIIKILHSRYPSFGKYQSSCPGLDASKEKRWCQKCSDCVRFAVYMLANNFNPKSIGIKMDVFNKKMKKYHSIFNKKEEGRYEKASGDEQLKFAYYLAYKNGARGHLMDLFKEKFYDEIKQNEKKLYKKYYKIHSSSIIPKKIRNNVISIYKEELGC